MKDWMRLVTASAFLWTSSAVLASEPAAIAPSDPAFARAESSFQGFAAEWMKKMAAAEAHGRKTSQGSTYRGYGDDFKIELKSTGSSVAPYVGLLRYQEHQCAAGKAESCQVTSTTAVTEIFRFQGGRWVY